MMKAKQIDSVSYMVESGSSEYLVWFSNKRWTCDCVGYVVGGVDPGFECKHIVHVKGVIELSKEEKHD